MSGSTSRLHQQSDQSRRLERLIQNVALRSYGAHANPPAALKELKDFLREREQLDNPRFIFEQFRYGNTAFTDAVHLPYYGDHYREQLQKYPEAIKSLADSNARDLLRILNGFVGSAIKSGKIKKEEYADLLTARNERGFSVLHQAVYVGNPNLLYHVLGVLKVSVSKEQYQKLLVGCSEGEYSLMHDAVKTGDAELVKHVFAELKANTTEDYYRGLLIKRTGHRNNLFHTMLRYNTAPLVLDYVMREFRTAFGRDNYRGIVDKLLRQKNVWDDGSRGETPVDNHTPEWAKRVLATTDSKRSATGKRDWVDRTDKGSAPEHKMVRSSNALLTPRTPFR